MTAAAAGGGIGALLSPRVRMLYAGLAAAAVFESGPAAKTALMERICKEAAAAGLPVVFIGGECGE